MQSMWEAVGYSRAGRQDLHKSEVPGLGEGEAMSDRKVLLLEVNGRLMYDHEHYVNTNFFNLARLDRAEVYKNIAVVLENGRIDVTLTAVGGAVTHHTFMGQIHVLWGEVKQ